MTFYLNDFLFTQVNLVYALVEPHAHHQEVRPYLCHLSRSVGSTMAPRIHPGLAAVVEQSNIGVMDNV